ncbi:MAG TPA: SUMF1/EgtB/PvdO family nonheme iron enzyme [Terriglobales bacterium]|nr:SUMF1/EgtB/PvdO family nonheme iron enzyme [Terriglobales bacterium]
MPRAEIGAERIAAVHDELLERWSDARCRSDALFNLVRENALYERPIPERHRIIFYLGHLEAFDWNLLNGSIFGLKSLHPEFDRLFAFGIDPVGGGLPTDLPSDWPAVDVVRDYVNNIRNCLDTNVEKLILEPHFRTDDGFSLDTLLNVAIEHRLMHIETLSYMLHQLPLDTKVRPRAQQAVSANLALPPVAHRMVSVPAGVITLGLARDAKDFGWDNEYEGHTVEVPAFEIDRYKVTNRQYLEFMAAGGYETRAFWNDDDWNWKTAGGISHPLFWKKDGDRWLYRTMFDEVQFDEVVLDWPVYVSQAEASAYARWAGKSLPTEQEWQRTAYGTVDGNARFYPWGSETPNKKLGNFDFHHWDPVPVYAFPEGQSAFGIHDMLGNGWEWTSTAFAPYPGFTPFPFYLGYSADFFDGKHFVMKGGSARTAASMLRPTFRNWFQPHYQYVYAGFRCVRRRMPKGI